MNERKFIGFALTVSLLLLLGLIGWAEAEEPLIVVFYEEDCPDCIRMEGVLEELLSEHPNLTVVHYEINDPGASDLLWRLSSRYGILTTKVPVIFVGEEAIVGAGRAEEVRLRTAVEDCLLVGCPSPFARPGGMGLPWGDLFVLGLFVSLLVLFLLLQGG